MRKAKPYPISRIDYKLSLTMRSDNVVESKVICRNADVNGHEVMIGKFVKATLDEAFLECMGDQR